MGPDSSKIARERTAGVVRAAEVAVPRRSGEQRSSSEHFPSKLFGFVGSLTQDMLETIAATTSHPSPCLSLSFFAK